MSYATWAKEFYPIPAEKTKRADALDHSIQKWRGLSPAALKRHGMSIEAGVIGCTDGSLYIDGDSCSLCYHFYKFNDSPCRKCPGYKANGVECRDMYFNFIDTGLTRPMLMWLRKAKK